MSSPKPPKPTSQELNLQTQQASLLEQQRVQLEQQLRDQQLLQPLLYQQAGLQPIYGPVQAQQQRTAPPGMLFGGIGADGQPSFVPDTPRNRAHGGTREYALPVTEQQVVGYQDAFAQDREAQRARQVELENLQQQFARQQLEQATEAQRLEDLLTPELLRGQGYEGIYDASGKLTGVSPTEGLLRQRQIEGKLQERSLAALEGRLPVDPALLQDLEREEATIRETLRRQVGSGYETSSPGIETLGQFAQRKSAILEGARRGDISLAQQLSLAQGEGRRADTSATLGTLQGLYPVGGGSDLASAFGGGTSQQRLQQIVQGLTGGSSLGNVAGGLGQLQQQLAGQRLGSYQQYLAGRQARTQQFGTYGTLIGGALGTAAGAYFGNPLLGAQLGTTAGSLAGTGLSYL